MQQKTGVVKPKKTFSQWLKSRKGQQAVIIILFSIIPLLLLFTFTYLPFAEMVKFSFYKMKYVGKREFVGFDNYAALFRRKDIVKSMILCLYYMVGAVFQIALALYLATVLSMKVKGGNLFKGIIFFPYLINGIAIGFIFRFFYARGYVLDTVLQALGFELEQLPKWLQNQQINNWSLVVSSVWRYCGQQMVLFIGAIMSVDDTLYEAAKIDGANRFQQFKYIILPSIKTIVTLNIILSISGSLSAFEAPYVITDGANGTGTFFIIMNTIAHVDQKVGLASAMAVFLLVIIIICTLLQKLLFKYIFRNMEADDESLAAKKARKKAAKADKKAAKVQSGALKGGM